MPRATLRRMNCSTIRRIVRVYVVPNAIRRIAVRRYFQVSA